MEHSGRRTLGCRCQDMSFPKYGIQAYLWAVDPSTQLICFASPGSIFRLWRFMKAEASRLSGLGRHVAGWLIPGDDLNQLQRSAISMPQRADHRVRNCFAGTKRLDFLLKRHVVLQRQARAGVIILVEVSSNTSQQVHFIENDEMIKALATGPSDESLDVRRLLRATVCEYDLLSTDVLDALGATQRELSSKVGSVPPEMFRRSMRKEATRACACNFNVVDQPTRTSLARGSAT